MSQREQSGKCCEFRATDFGELKKKKRKWLDFMREAKKHISAHNENM